MGMIYDVKHRYAIRLKFGNKISTSLTKSVLQAKVIIFSTIKENVLLFSRKFLPLFFLS